MLDRNVVNRDLLPVHLTYQEVFGQFVLDQLRKKHLNAFSVNWLMVLIGLVVIFIVLKIWFKVPCFREDSLAQ